MLQIQKDVFNLAAVSEGLGTQLFASWDDAEEEVNQLLGAPDKHKQGIGVNIGVQHPDFKPETKVLKSKSKWIFRERIPFISALKGWAF
jgi:hypothetical protein